MKEHKLYRKIRSRTVLVFFVCLIGIGGAAYHICQLSAQTQKEQARYTARAASRRIEAQINKYLVVADILKKLVEDGYEIGPDEFQNMSKFMMDDGGVIEGIEYAPDGTGALILDPLFSVSQKERVEEKSSVYEIRICDNGIGMSEKFQRKQFELFEREEGEEVAGIEGTGLGLPIVKRLVDMLDGEITCHSKKGEGTSYTLRFVLEEAEKEDTCTQDSGIETDRASAEFEGIHALLVEDNELNREIALYMLQEMKFRTDTAENGARAVEKVKASLEDSYDIIFMDVQMPVMNGYEATRAIRNLENHSLAEVPVVAMTANAFEEDKRNAAAAGMNGHIAKPVEIQKLVEAVRQVLQ
ncbi:response regulator [Bariatricus sp. HCP28S3_D3]|uniref:ATP-binding response regulator n=1 Tax=Bariatricus sp. HCP28S3_D3 TaxID=3438901 RepID=UPI003F8C8812